jgi:hypothetical protein
MRHGYSLLGVSCRSCTPFWPHLAVPASTHAATSKFRSARMNRATHRHGFEDGDQSGVTATSLWLDRHTGGLNLAPPRGMMLMVAPVF